MSKVHLEPAPTPRVGLMGRRQDDEFMIWCEFEGEYGLGHRASAEDSSRPW